MFKINIHFLKAIYNFRESINCAGEEWLSPNMSKTYRSTIRDILNISFDESVLYLHKIAYTYVLPSIIGIGILGNLLNLLVLSKPFLKGATKVYLTALAVADLGVMISAVSMSLRLNRVHGNSYPEAFFYAHIEIFVVSMFMASSVFIIICLTVERYLAVCIPHKYRKIHKKGNAKVVVFGSYALSVIINSPLVLIKNACVIRKPEQLRLIWDYHENLQVTRTAYWKIYLIFSESATRIVPALILATLNVLIIKEFRKRAAMKKKLLLDINAVTVKNQTDSLQNVIKLKHQKAQDEKRIIVLLHAIVCLFFIAMIPSVLLSLLYSENKEFHFSFQVFRAASNNLEVANFALNFYVYCVCSKEFRSAFKSSINPMFK